MSDPVPPAILQFRPYVAPSTESKPEDIGPTPEAAVGTFEGSVDGEADATIVDDLPAASRFLLIHQEEWQKQLLAQFGELALIDATYKTTCYDLALFFVVVKTNISYIVVAGMRIPRTVRLHANYPEDRLSGMAGSAYAYIY